MGTLELVEAINGAQVLRSRVFGGIVAGHFQQGLGVLGFKVYLLVVSREWKTGPPLHDCTNNTPESQFSI